MLFTGWLEEGFSLEEESYFYYFRREALRDLGWWEWGLMLEVELEIVEAVLVLLVFSL